MVVRRVHADQHQPAEAGFQQKHTGADGQATAGRLNPRTAPGGEMRQHVAVYLAVDVVLVYEPLVVLCLFGAKLDAARAIDEPHDIVHGPIMLKTHTRTRPRSHAPARAVRGEADSRAGRSAQGGGRARPRVRAAGNGLAGAVCSGPAGAAGCRCPPGLCTGWFPAADRAGPGEQGAPTSARDH